MLMAFVHTTKAISMNMALSIRTRVVLLIKQALATTRLVNLTSPL